MEDARREIIALSGIPAPYLGYADVIELKEQLVHINVTFATEIINLQETDAASMNRVFSIIGEIKNSELELIKYVTFSFIPPIALILQLIEMTLSSIGNISTTFQSMNLDFDPYYFLKQYVPHIDWDNFKKVAEEKMRENKTKADIAASVGGGEELGGAPEE